MGDNSSSGKFSAGVGARGFDNKMRECYAAEKVFVKSLMEDAVTALKLDKKVGQRSRRTKKNWLCFERVAVCTCQA